jgi:hypothetical protein
MRFYTSTIYIIVYYVNSSVIENPEYISTSLDETLKRLDYIGLVTGIIYQYNLYNSLLCQFERSRESSLHLESAR